MSRMLLAPGRYIQGAGAIHETGEHAVRLGKNALLTGGNTALSICGSAIQSSLNKTGVNCHQAAFNGECCDAEIERLSGVARSSGCDLIIAAGGGKIIDTGKAVAHDLGLPVMIVPTIAATDAPCSALSVVYTPEGVFDRYLVLPTNPDCVLVDTAIVARAPARFLVSGMGDALATFWEADTCAKSCKPNALTGATPRPPPPRPPPPPPPPFRLGVGQTVLHHSARTWIGGPAGRGARCCHPCGGGCGRSQHPAQRIRV